MSDLENPYINAMERAERLNLIKDFKDWQIKRTEHFLKKENLFNNQYFKQLGIDSNELFRMITYTALSKEGSNVLTLAILQLLDILSLKNQSSKNIQKFYVNLQGAFMYAYQQDQIIGTGELLYQMHNISKTSTKLEKLTIPTNAFQEQKANIQKQAYDYYNKNSQMESEH